MLNCVQNLAYLLQAGTILCKLKQCKPMYIVVIGILHACARMFWLVHPYADDYIFIRGTSTQSAILIAWLLPKSQNRGQFDTSPRTKTFFVNHKENSSNIHQNRSRSDLIIRIHFTASNHALTEGNCMKFLARFWWHIELV